jgi:MFS family permease
MQLLLALCYSTSIVVLAQELQQPLADITLLTGYNTVVAGASCPLTSALSTKYGKRPVFLFSSIACLVGSIIGSFSQTYNTLLAARIIQGLGFASYESLTFTTIGDLFYVHERGFWINVIAFTMTGVSNMSSIITGPVTLNLGWHYLFHLLVAFSGFQTILLFFFTPETTYIRDASFHQQPSLNGVESEKSSPLPEHIESATVFSHSPPPAKTFWQEMAIYTGVYSNESLLTLLLGPFLCLTNVAALWIVITTGIVTSFYVAISYIVAQLFSVPPYSLSAAEVGYLSVGPFLGGIIGSVLVALTTDRVIVAMTKRNNGIYEPEFRLPLVAFALLLTAGLCGFGALSQATGNIYLIDFMWGLTIVGICFATGPCSSYAIDAFRGMSNEIFVANVMFKNFLFFGYSYFINNWVTSDGPADPFYIFGGISAALILTTIPVYAFGKQYRSLWYRHNVMEMLKIKVPADI